MRYCDKEIREGDIFVIFEEVVYIQVSFVIFLNIYCNMKKKLIFGYFEYLVEFENIFKVKLKFFFF